MPQKHDAWLCKPRGAPGYTRTSRLPRREVHCSSCVWMQTGCPDLMPVGTFRLPTSPARARLRTHSMRGAPWGKGPGRHAAPASAWRSSPSCWRTPPCPSLSSRHAPCRPHQTCREACPCHLTPVADIEDGVSQRARLPKELEMHQYRTGVSDRNRPYKLEPLKTSCALTSCA